MIIERSRRPHSPIILPGAGFKTWLILVAIVSAFCGFASSIAPDTNFLITLFVVPMIALFALFSLWPIGSALRVSVRRRGHRLTAAAYGLVPVLAAVIAVLCAHTGFKATEWGLTQIRLQYFSRAIEAAREAGHVVTTTDSWIDPGPPTRARFSLPSLYVIGIYVIYAETNDTAWLHQQAASCQPDGRVVTLGRNFYRISGDC